MECPACSVSSPEKNRFCQNCGAELPLACPSCNFVPTPGAKFCGGCGLALQRQHALPECAAFLEDPELLLQRNHLVQTSEQRLRAKGGSETEIEFFLQAAHVDVVVLHEIAHVHPSN